jgi:SAM-dependent methyltransferase
MVGRTRYGPTAVRIYQMLFDPLISPLRPRVTRLCRSLGVESVLDIACGTGAQCRALARTGIRATGLDLSSEMIRRAGRYKTPGTEYVEGSAYRLPFDHDSFDACLLLLALHEHTELERSEMLSEALRVARSHVLVADYEQPAQTWIHPAWQGIRLVETLAGPEHREGFGQFVRDGSLTGFLARHGYWARVAARSHLRTIVLTSISAADSPRTPAP